MSRRLALLVLVLMLACLACSLWLGGSRLPALNARLNPQLPGLQELRTRLTVRVAGGDMKLDAAASGDDCLLSAEQFYVPLDQICVFTLRSDPNLTRQMRLSLTGAALELSYRLEQPGAVTMDGQMKPGDPAVLLDVFPNAQRVTARLALNGCRRPFLPTPVTGHGTPTPQAFNDGLPCTVKLK